MLLPSKELLSEVLGVKRITDINLTDNYITYKYFAFEYDIFEDKVNIYELMHKMKVWALSKGYRIDSAITDGRYGECVLSAGIGFSMCFEADTEFEAVTQACEFILTRKKTLCEQ